MSASRSSPRLSYDTFFAWDGVGPINPDARPFIFYDPVVYHGARLTFEPDEQFRFYFGVDNITNELPPFDLTGIENTAAGNSGAIYPNTGRFFYGGAEVRF